MTIVAGYYCLSGSTIVPETLEQDIRSALRRNDDTRGQVNVAKSPGFYLCKWDSCAFEEPVWSEIQGGGVSTLVGDPLFTQKNERLHRAAQLECLNLFLEGVDSRLAMTRGAFSLVCFSQERNELRLATDILGIRSLYFTVQNGFLVFASAIRILESISSIKRHMSMIGTAEQCIYGQPLGSRSPYEEISILREAEVLRASDGEVNVTKYFDWSQSISCQSSGELAAENLFQHFLDGIKLRAYPGGKTLAFLSGGMDSRAIVASLIASGHPVVALNFSPNESQDQDYAIRFAEVAGRDCTLHCRPRDDDPNFSMLAARTIASLERKCLGDLARPKLLWSGDGGSVGLGHVYMDEKMVDLIENEGIEKAAQYFMKLHRNQLPVRVLKSPWKNRLPEQIYQNVLSEIKRYRCNDVGRQLYLFLLLNDQRRHMHKHFESIDEHGLEFLTPFFDSVFLRFVASTPVRMGLLHRLYAQWFAHLPEFALITPWQTYPGHVECPVKCEKKLSYQWSNTKRKSSGPFAERLKRGVILFSSSCNPISRHLFSTTRVFALACMEVLGLRDSQYVLRTIQTFQRIWARTN